MNSYSDTIHGNGSEQLLFPFRLEIDPMESLLLVNFEKDADTLYTGFEPQVFDDDINGSGHLVIGWRKDKKVDVYHQKSLHPNPEKYSIAGAGLNKMIAVDMNPAQNNMNETGVHAHYRFKDILGRDIEIFINEKNPKKRKPFGILAPMGDAATHPFSMPLVLLQDFYFVRKNQTEIVVSIDQKRHRVDEFPVPMDFQQMTFLRYSPKPLIATLNPAHKGLLEVWSLKPGQPVFEKGNCSYEIEWSSQIPCVSSVRVENKVYPLTMRFEPAFPSLNHLPPNTRQQGTFRISGHESVGVISGRYRVESRSNDVAVSIVPSGGWHPKVTKLSTWLLFNAVKVFKQWPKTYRWDAILRMEADETWHMESKWIRTGKILKD